MPLPNRVGETETRLRPSAQSFLERQAETARVASVEVVPRVVEHFFVGSTAERLVRKADISILLVLVEDETS
mgnify:CR=1 FL=1